MKKSDMTTQEVKLLLKRQGIEIRPSYCHDDYMYTSFTMPYPLKHKVDRISKRYNISRSKVVQMLIDSISEKDFLNDLDRN